MKKLVLCRSDTGDGGWSLHAPEATDDEIGSGDAPPLISGPSEWDESRDEWSRPSEADYESAVMVFARRVGAY